MIYERYPVLETCRRSIEEASFVLIRCFEAGGKLLVCGNGGSCADSDHIVGELMKGFLLKRPVGAEMTEKLIRSGMEKNEAEGMAFRLQGALPAISLPSQTALLSAFANDVDPDMVYAQMVFGYGRPDDLLLCLSTSGNSHNVVAAAKIAKAMGLTTVAMTGEKESVLSRLCDVAIRVPETETYKVQELHLPVYHYLCARAEERFFKDLSDRPGVSGRGNTAL